MKIRNLKIDTKKIAALILSGSLVLTMAGCSKQETKNLPVEEPTTTVEESFEVESEVTRDQLRPSLTTTTDKEVTIVAPEADAPSFVYSDNIIGDIYYEESRMETRQKEAESLRYLFENKTNKSITVGDITHAAELSDVLNGYYPGPNEYSNTSYSGIVNFNVEDLYYRYQLALNRGTVDEFCAEQMKNEANVDAYVTFGCGTVKAAIEEELVRIAKTYVHSKENQLTSYAIVTDNNCPYIVLDFEGNIVKINITGDYMMNLIQILRDLNNHYNDALRTIEEDTDVYENSFTYNGGYIGHNDSAYFSAGDDYKKEDLRDGIYAYEGLRNGKYTSSITTNNSVDRLTVAQLVQMGYTNEQIQSAIVATMQLYMVNDYTISY